MPDTLDVSQDIQPIVALIHALCSTRPPNGRGRRVAWLRQQVGAGRAALERQKEGFDKIYTEVAGSDLSISTIRTLAREVLKEQRMAANKIYPGMEVILREIFASSDTDIASYWHECFNIGIAVVTNFRTLHDRLLNLAAERRAGAGEILRARPVEGEIDHGALAREIIARFPKILAALAK